MRPGHLVRSLSFSFPSPREFRNLHGVAFTEFAGLIRFVGQPEPRVVESSLCVGVVCAASRTFASLGGIPDAPRSVLAVTATRDLRSFPCLASVAFLLTALLFHDDGGSQ